MARKKKSPPAYQSRFYDPKDSLSYASESTLAAALPKHQRSGAKKWLDKQQAHVLFKRAPKRFQRLKVIAVFQQQIQADLVDVSHMAKFNSDVRYLLTAIDPFSKKAFVEPVLKKDAISVTNAFERILDRLGFKPKIFFSDQGKEFLNSTFQSMLKRRNIKIFTSKDADIKASVVERFNQTLMTRVHKFLTRANSSRYLDALQDIISGYNNSRHNATGVAPSKVTLENKETVWHRLYKKTSRVAEKKKKVSRLKLGDPVLIPKTRKPFAKGYRGEWTGEIFKIDLVRNTEPVTYNLADLQGDRVIGIFYESELQKTTVPSAFEIETVLDKKKDKLLVKWLHYPKKFNSWISTKDLK